MANHYIMNPLIQQLNKTKTRKKNHSLPEFYQDKRDNQNDLLTIKSILNFKHVVNALGSGGSF
jgi:hypothetical protein